MPHKTYSHILFKLTSFVLCTFGQNFNRDVTTWNDRNILEMLCFTKLNSVLEASNAIDNKRQQLNIPKAWHTIQHTLKAMPCVLNTWPIMLDMPAAFDRIDYTILLHRLSHLFWDIWYHVEMVLIWPSQLHAYMSIVMALTQILLQ